MTEKELNQLFFLNRETDRLQKDLAELEQSIGVRSSIITGMPRGGQPKGISDFVAELVDLRRLISLNLQKIQVERSRLERYIGNIESAEIRLLFRLRHINGMTWDSIAIELGYEYESTPRKKHKQYLKLAEKTD